jgi:hypothetical protein
VADHHDDDVVHRALEALRELPPPNAAAIDRIVGAAARLREVDAEPHADDLLPRARPWALRWPVVGAIAAAAALLGFLAGGRRSGSDGPSPLAGLSAPASELGSVPSGGGTRVAATPAAAVGDVVAIPTQFMFDARGAKRVVLVGDFNAWDERALPLERETGSSLWSVTVPLTPGRHVYAFLVDSVWTIDPRAPQTRDPDFGVTGSVIIVGKP